MSRFVTHRGKVPRLVFFAARDLGRAKSFLLFFPLFWNSGSSIFQSKKSGGKYLDAILSGTANKTRELWVTVQFVCVWSFRRSMPRDYQT